MYSSRIMQHVYKYTHVRTSSTGAPAIHSYLRSNVGHSAHRTTPIECISFNFNAQSQDHARVR